MRRVAKVVLWLGLGVVLACGTLVLWLLRDPEPYFLERRSMVVAVDSMAETADETALVQDFTLLAANDLRVELAVRRPLGADTLTERRPLFIILGGQRRGKRAGALIGDTRGNIFASLEYPFEGDEDADGFALVRQVP